VNPNLFVELWRFGLESYDKSTETTVSLDFNLVERSRQLQRESSLDTTSTRRRKSTEKYGER
jgi:hypothetical protein